MFSCEHTFQVFLDCDCLFEPLAVPSFVKALDAYEHGLTVQLLLNLFAHPGAAYEFLYYYRTPLMSQLHEQLHRHLSFEMTCYFTSYEMLGPRDLYGCEVFLLTLGENPPHLALNHQRRLLESQQFAHCLSLFHPYECLHTDCHLDFKFFHGNLTTPMSSPSFLDYLSALLFVVRLIQFAFISETGFFADGFEL